jgi:hypothetical protein
VSVTQRSKNHRGWPRHSPESCLVATPRRTGHGPRSHLQVTGGGRRGVSRPSNLEWCLDTKDTRYLKGKNETKYEKKDKAEMDEADGRCLDYLTTLFQLQRREDGLERSAGTGVPVLKHHVMKMYKKVEIHLHALLTSVPCGNDGSFSCSHHRTESWMTPQGWRGEKTKPCWESTRRLATRHSRGGRPTTKLTSVNE